MERMIPVAVRLALDEAEKIPDKVLKARALQKAQWAVYRNLVFKDAELHLIVDGGTVGAFKGAFGDYYAIVKVITEPMMSSVYQLLTPDMQAKVDAAKAEKARK